MTTPQLITKAVNRHQGSQSSLPKRLYVFAVTSLTMFLICQIVWREPITGYVALASVEYDYAASHAASPPREVNVQKLLASDSALDYILDQVDHLRSYIRIRTTESTADRTAYEIRLVGTTTEEATKLANAVAEHLARLSTRRDEVQPLSLKNAESKLLSARQRENQLRQQLSTVLLDHCHFVKEHLPNARTANALAADEPDDATVAVEKLGPENRAGELNPHWIQLKNELIATQQKIDELQVLRTDQHPMVKSLGIKVREIKDRLSQTPRTFGPVFPPTDNSDPEIQANAERFAEAAQSDGAVRDVVTSMSDDLQRQLARLTQLSESIEDSKAVRLAAEDNLIRLAAERPKESHAKVAITPATVVASIGGNPSLPQLCLITLASALFGGVVSTLAVRPLVSGGQLKTSNVQSLQTASTEPDVNASASSEREKLQRLRQSAMVTTRICELALVGFVGLILLIALSDSPLAAGFLDAPFQTLSEVIQRITP